MKGKVNLITILSTISFIFCWFVLDNILHMGLDSMTTFAASLFFAGVISIISLVLINVI